MDDVRASYLRFPAWSQHFWTWQTGKALPGQKPLLRHTWSSYLAVTLAQFPAVARELLGVLSRRLRSTDELAEHLQRGRPEEP